MVKVVVCQSRDHAKLIEIEKGKDGFERVLVEVGQGHWVFFFLKPTIVHRILLEAECLTRF